MRAVYGGSFNPFHLGHREVVRAALSRVVEGEPVAGVIVVPAFAHPFGRDLAPFAHRVAMTRLSLAEAGLADDNRVTVSEIEAALPVPSFTIHTLDALAKTFASERLRFIAGPDVPHQKEKWHRWQEIESRFGFISVAPVLRNDGTEFRATAIRQRLARGEKIDDDVGHAVAEYIRQHDLYRA